MSKIAVLIVVLTLLPAAQAQDIPTVAIVRYGSLEVFDVTEGAILDVLESYGFISAEENEILHTRQDLQGERVNIIWGSADFDLPAANLMLEQALDAEPDALVTISTTVTQLAINATAEMEDPPVILFSSVYNPYETGIARSACIKPAHVTGSLSTTPYEDVLSLLLRQSPDIKTIGTIFNSAEPASVVGVEEIMRIADGLGLAGLAAGVTNISEINLAAESLINKGIDAFVMPIDLRTGAAGLPIVVNLGNEFGIPVFNPFLFAINYGATFSTGFYHYYAQGENVGRLLAAVLNEELDVAATGIHQQQGTVIGVNLDASFEQGLQMSAEIFEAADMIVVGGDTLMTERVGVEMIRQGEIIPLEERLEGDRAFLAELRCTPERIAEEQAELDAEES